MARIRAYLVMVIIFALAVHLVWVAVAPFIPYTMGGLVAVAILGFFYFRRRW
jgi:hypothetical protein